jgi:hypothetical protein
MIKIVGKGYKFLLVQLSDFLEIAKTIVVSLKSVEDKKKYEKIFGRKLEDKKDNPKVRIIHINQSLLIDFVSNLFEKSTSSAVIHDHILSKSSSFKIVFQSTDKKNKKEAKNSRRCIISIFQTLLPDFFESTINVLKRKINIPYKVKPLIVKSKDYMETVLPRNQILAFDVLKNLKDI